MTSPEHPDATAETTQRLGQGLAVLATLAEAGTRLAAEELRRRERERELAQQRREQIRKALIEEQEFAARVARQRAGQDRRRLREATDEWIAHADLYDLARTWRLARSREGQPGFESATHIAETVEDRLREQYSAPMRLYDDLVAAGASRATAMRMAAEQMARVPPMRPHGRRDTPALHAVDPDAFSRHLDDERANLDLGHLPDAQPHYQQQLRDLGVHSPAAEQAVREILTARAETATPHAAGGGATPDPPDTTMNENTPTGRPAHGVDQATADQDTTASRRTPAQIASDFYPDGPATSIVPPDQRPPGLNNRRPADIRYDLTQQDRRRTR